jgi:endonuclease/exonuclease/phosphatase (EEP) superfamily protein YafD
MNVKLYKKIEKEFSKVVVTFYYPTATILVFLVLLVFLPLVILFFFWWDQNLNLWPHGLLGRQAGSLPLEPLHQPFFVTILFLR